MNWTTLLLLGVCTVIVWCVVWEARGRRDHQRYVAYIKSVFRQVADFAPDEFYVSAHWGNSIAVDRARRVFCFARPTTIGTQPEIVRLLACRILQCELLEDGATLQQSRRLATAGGAIAGGILGGTFGMIARARVGGGAGYVRSKTEASSIEVKVLVSGCPEPSYSLVFFKGPPLERGAGLYAFYRPAADRWYDLLRVAALENHQSGTAR